MAASEFNVERVDPLHNIASATPAGGDKDHKRKKYQRDNRNPATTDDEKVIVDAEGSLNVTEEQHVIDFEA